MKTATAVQQVSQTSRLREKSHILLKYSEEKRMLLESLFQVLPSGRHILETL